jgi:hypothetical protein
MTGQYALAEQARREVLALHEFFVAWFSGAENADFGHCEAAFAEDFQMVTPDGAVHARPAILERLRLARRSLPHGFSIAISELEPVWQQHNAILLRYVEQQYREGRITRRRSTALFIQAPTAPRGVVWRHLQETWMQVAHEQQQV